ncbi:MAG TPA: hypothetical protein VEA38_04110 [Terriglobales bacterium]|nr:hypothetical protein [Terriglobales bacterium]
MSLVLPHAPYRALHCRDDESGPACVWFGQKPYACPACGAPVVWHVAEGYDAFVVTLDGAPHDHAHPILTTEAA